MLGISAVLVSFPQQISHRCRVWFLALTIVLTVAANGAFARNCGGTCANESQFQFRRPYVEAYTGTGPYWKVRCIKLMSAGGKHNVFTFLYRNGAPANDPIYARIGTLEVGANWKDELLDGVREQYWNTDLYANDGNFYSISVKNQPSDTVRDIHTRHGDIAGCGTFGHFLWEIIFDWVESAATATPTLTPTRTPTRTATPTPTFSATPTQSGPDTDRDGIPDSLEQNPPSPGRTNRLLSDSDGDAVLDGDEDANRNGQRDSGETDARDFDTDDDGFPDGVELKVLNTNPLSAASPGALGDSDGDGLPDFLDPNPALRDTDGDRYNDGYESAALEYAAATNSQRYPVLGDVNRDSVLTNVDALVIQSLFMSLIDENAAVFGGESFVRSDPSRDGFITNVDALILQSFFLSLLGDLPI